MAVIISQEALDRTRPTPRKPHHLHRGHAEGGLHDAHIGHQGSPGPPTLVRTTQQPKTANNRSTRCDYREPRIVSQSGGRRVPLADGVRGAWKSAGGLEDDLPSDFDGVVGETFVEPAQQGHIDRSGHAVSPFAVHQLDE